MHYLHDPRTYVEEKYWNRFGPEKKAKIIDITSKQSSTLKVQSNNIDFQALWPNAPKSILLPNGRKLPVLSNEHVYTATRSLVLEKADKQIEQYVQNSNNFPVKITPEAYQKTLDLAQAVACTHDAPLETTMNLLRGVNDPSDCITDVMLAHNQIVTPAHCQSRGIIEDSMYRQKHQKLYAGWSHSHGNLSTFHSPEDDENLEQLLTLDRIAPRTFMYLQVDDAKAKAAIHCIPSIVVNLSGDKPYIATGISYTKPSTGKQETIIHHNLSLEFVNSDIAPASYPYSVLRDFIEREIHTSDSNVRNRTNN